MLAVHETGFVQKPMCMFVGMMRSVPCYPLFLTGIQQNFYFHVVRPLMYLILSEIVIKGDLSCVMYTVTTDIDDFCPVI